MSDIFLMNVDIFYILLMKATNPVQKVLEVKIWKYISLTEVME